MNKEIRYKGIALTPDPAAQPDGTLAVAANAEIHNGAVRPFVLAGTTTEAPLTVGDDIATLIYVHRTTAYTHLIATVGNNIYWFHEDGTAASQTYIANLQGIANVEAMGNTLVIMANDGMHYILWKGETYKYLGQKPPFLELAFTLSANYKAAYDRGTIETTDTSKTYEAAWRQMTYNATDCLSINSARNAVSFKENHIGDMQEAIWALINQTNALITKEGHFYAPFFVRYCYRMYDGTMFMHSAPVFMPVSMPTAYQVEIPNVFSSIQDDNINRIVNELVVKEEGGSDTDFRLTKLGFRYRPHNVALMCQLANYTALNQLLADWTDIIKSLDIFISTPITREDSAERIRTASRAANSYYIDNMFLTPFISKKRYPWYLGGDTDKVNDVICDIPLLSEEAYLDKIRSVAAFYKVHSYNLTDIPTSTYQEVPLNKSILPVLATQEQMSDDYKTHNVLMPAYDDRQKPLSSLYNYNSRLNVTGVQEKLFQGFPAHHLMCNANGDERLYVQDIYVYLNTEDGERVVKCHDTNGYMFHTSLEMLYNAPLFYPDNRAVKMEIPYNGQVIVLKMEACPMLNGAFTIGGIMKDLNTPFVTRTGDMPTPNDIFALPNKIYTSEVNNPFFFPAEGINTVGIGKILGIAATTRALTQGQFGQFPLMVFATDGIWALSVSSSGTYSASHPISREVTTNPNAICQTDQQVLFVTERALNTVTEQNVNSISPQLDGAPEDFTDTIPTLLQYLNNTSLDGHEQLAALLQYTDMPVETLQTAHVIYDFAANRLLIIPPVTSVALPTQQQTLNTQPILTYSIPDNAYTTAAIPPVLTAINAYPHPYLQFTDGTVMCLNKPYPYAQGVAQKTPVLLVTRPMAFGQAMYNINDFTHNYQGSSTPVIILFGSNDLQSWHYIGRTTRRKAYYMPTRAYRYLRYAIVTTLAPDEQYISTLLDVAEKFHKL